MAAIEAPNFSDRLVHKQKSGIFVLLKKEFLWQNH